MITKRFCVWIYEHVIIMKKRTAVSFIQTLTRLSLLFDEKVVKPSPSPYDNAAVDFPYVQDNATVDLWSTSLQDIVVRLIPNVDIPKL
jgi:hypothetical protein